MKKLNRKYVYNTFNPILYYMVMLNRTHKKGICTHEIETKTKIVYLTNNIYQNYFIQYIQQ